MNNNPFIFGNIQPVGSIDETRDISGGGFTVFDYPIDLTPSNTPNDSPADTTGNTVTGDLPQTATTANNNPNDNINDNTEPQVRTVDGKKVVTIGNQTIQTQLKNTETLDQKVKKFVEENPVIALGGLALVIYFVFIKD